MNRSHLTLPILLLGLALALAGCGGSDDSSSGTTAAATEASTTADTTGDTTAGSATTLNGNVGPGFDISLDGTDGIKAGAYTLVVNDQSSAHNFHLTGPGGVDVSTDVSGSGEKSFDVTLVPGEYRFQCDPHSSSMNGSFTVG